MNLYEIPNFPEKCEYLESRVRTLTFQPKVAHTQSSLQTQRLELVDKLTIPPIPVEYGTAFRNHTSLANT